MEGQPLTDILVLSPLGKDGAPSPGCYVTRLGKGPRRHFLYFIMGLGLALTATLEICKREGGLHLASKYKARAGVWGGLKRCSTSSRNFPEHDVGPQEAQNMVKRNSPLSVGA